MVWPRAATIDYAGAMTSRSSLRTAAIAVLGLLSLSAFDAWSRPARRSPLTPLADAQLFISPCGKPFRSKAGEPYPVVAWFREADADKDDHIDKAEFRAQAEAFFHILDLNKDGIVNDAEISFYERQVVPEIVAGLQPALFQSGRGMPKLILAQMGGGAMGAGQIDPGGGAESSDASPAKQKEDDGPPQGAAPYSLLNDAEPVRSADRSLEGRITLADFLARADHNFDALDFQENGYLTLDGLPQTPVQKIAAAARSR